MSTTTNIQTLINGCKPYLRNQLLDFANGEPALEAANIVIQTLLAPPFAWPFNRNTLTLNVVNNQADYPLVVQDFGFLETQWITDANNNVHPLEGALRLPFPTTNGAGRPTKLALQKDDSQGNLVFRLDKMPNTTYTVSADYQRKAPLLTSTASMLAPWPDHLRYVADLGFLTLMGMLVNDARVAWWEKMFTGRVLSLQDGLDEQDINLFLGTWQASTKMMARAQGSVQAGVAGRQA